MLIDMPGHVAEHCDTPRTFLKRPGTVWICTCKQIWVIEKMWAWDGSYKAWVKVDQAIEDRITRLEGLEDRLRKEVG